MTIAHQIAPYVSVPHYKAVISSLSDEELLSLVAVYRADAASTKVVKRLTDKALTRFENGEVSLTFVGGHIAAILSGSMPYLG
jgi:hypothetical protein